MCPACNTELILIHDNETVSEWERRSGIPCPDYMPVWWKYKNHGCPWRLDTYYRSLFLEADIIIIANGYRNPGDDYQKENKNAAK
jgi:hypothetical protein